jgi:transposase-like protein
MIAIAGPRIPQQSLIEAWVKSRALASITCTSQTGFCGRCGIPMHRFGYNRGGSQRWRCHTCNTTRSAGTEWRGNNVLSPEKVEDIKQALLTPGLSLRQIERLTHHNKATISSYRDLLGIQRPPCPCGQPAGHKGWCSWQFQRHPIRQATLAKTWVTTIPAWMRPAIWVLGSDSMHRSEVRTIHCQWKACPFPVVDGTTRCRQHANFYEFPMTMHDTALNLEEVWSPKNPDQNMPLVIGRRPASTDNLERSLTFRHNGYFDDRHRNAGDSGANIQASPSMRHMGHGKGRGSSKTTRGKQRIIARAAHNSSHRQSHDPTKRWSREALELEANRILGEEPIELDFVPESERQDGAIYREYDPLYD